jgi:hypothetical protein
VVRRPSWILTLFRRHRAQVSGKAFFPPHNIAFRTAQGSNPNAHSECHLLPVDLWRAGLGRIMATTRARVTYNVHCIHPQITAH